MPWITKPLHYHCANGSTTGRLAWKPVAIPLKSLKKARRCAEAKPSDGEPARFSRLTPVKSAALVPASAAFSFRGGCRCSVRC
jgi:hypothetical protein